MVLITIVTGADKPTNITGGPHNHGAGSMEISWVQRRICNLLLSKWGNMGKLILRYMRINIGDISIYFMGFLMTVQHIIEALASWLNGT